MFSGKEETLTLGTLSTPESGGYLFACLTCPNLDEVPLWMSLTLCFGGTGSYDGEGSCWLKPVGFFHYRKGKRGVGWEKPKRKSKIVSVPVHALLVTASLLMAVLRCPSLTFPNCTLRGAAQTVLPLWTFSTSLICASLSCDVCGIHLYFSFGFFKCEWLAIGAVFIIPDIVTAF